MNLAGWSLAELGTLFAIAGGAITVLYLLQMRRRQVEVPFAALWEQVSRETESSRLWKRLRRILSWLLQLFLLALLLLALGDPRPEAWFTEPTTVAIVIDRSASMEGPYAEDGTSAGEESSPPAAGRTRLEAAKARARVELAALGLHDQAVIIAAGPEVEVLAPLGRNLEDLDASLDDLRTQPGEADFASALALARNVLDGRPNPRILVLTDAAVDEGGLGALRRCGEEQAPACALQVFEGPDDNVAITAFAARRYPGDREKVEILVELHNLGDEATTLRLDVEADGVSVGARELSIDPGARVREVLSDLDAARSRLVAKLEPVAADPDSARRLGPAFDDRAWAVVPPLEPIDVALVTDGGNLFLEAALLTLDDHVRLTGVSPEKGGAGNPEVDEADIVFFDVADAALPAELPAAHTVVFDPHRHQDSPVPVALGREVERPRITEQARNHQILEGVVFKDVNLARGTTFETQPGDIALVKHLGEPLVVLRESGEHAILAIGFDPRQSDLVLRVAFPLLVANAVTYLERSIPGFVAAVPVGANRELGLAELGLGNVEATHVEVTAPGGAVRRVGVQRGRFRMRALEPGVHTIRVVDGDGDGPAVDLAVNQASIAASNLRSRAEDLPEDMLVDETPSPAPPTEGPLWTMLLLAVGVLMTVEWLTYHRRTTV